MGTWSRPLRPPEPPLPVSYNLILSEGKPVRRSRQGRAPRGNSYAWRTSERATGKPVIRRAFKEDVGVKQVWPAHTSTIGYWKYMERYGIIIHHAAAPVITPRAIGFRERITRELKQKIQILSTTKKFSSGRSFFRRGVRIFLNTAAGPFAGWRGAGY